MKSYQFSLLIEGECCALCVPCVLWFPALLRYASRASCAPCAPVHLAVLAVLAALAVIAQRRVLYTVFLTPDIYKI